MSLTVPRAGVVGGVAPQLSRVPVMASDAGAAFADLGQRMAQVGTAIEEERSQRELAKARVQMMTGLNDLRLKYEQIGDPDQIDTGFVQDANELRQQILGGLSARSQSNGDLMFAEMEASHKMALGGRAIDLRQSQRIATLNDTTAAAVQAGATADPTTQAVYLGQLEDNLKYLVSTGTITPEEAQKRRTAAAAEMEQARATQMLSTDPAGLISAIDKGEAGGFSRMDPSRMQEYRARGVAAVQAEESRRLSEEERAKKERVAAASAFLKDGISIFGKGRDWADADKADALLSDPQIAALPEAQEYRQAQLLHRELPSFAAMPMTEKRALLADAEAKPISKPYEADIVAAMRSQIAADEKGWREDRFAHAAEIGLAPAPELADPIRADATELAKSLHARVAYSTSLRDAGHVEDLRFFSPDEAATWKEATALSQSPAQRAKLASAMAVAMGDQVEDAAAEIGTEPVFAYVGGYLANGGSEITARQIFDGERALASGDTRMPSGPNRRSAFFRGFSELFSDGTTPGQGDEAAARDQIIGAADALYAWRRRSSSEASDTMLDEETYQQAVHDVLGGTGTFGSADARGGVQKIRGTLTLVPQGISGREVENTLDLFKVGATDRALAEDAWRQVSASGNVPRTGGEPLSARDISKVSLRWVAGNAYEMTVIEPQTEKLVSLWGDDGKPYLVDITKLANWGRGK